MTSWAQQLEDDLAWREGELGILKLQIASAGKGSPKYTALLRALWCMLYAHFEGFTKFCWDMYLNAIEAESLQRQELIAPLMQLSLETDFKMLRKDLSTAALIAFIRTNFPVLLSGRASFDLRLETNSNLWPKVFREECAKINLSCGTLDLHDQKLRTLVYKRNEIAHGKSLVIPTLSQYEEYEAATTLVMHELAVLILDCLEKKSFRE